MGNRGKNKPHPHPPNNGGDKHQCNSSGNTHVRGEVEVSLAPSLVEKHNTERQTDNAREDTKRIVAYLTLVGVFAAAAFAGWQGWSANKAAVAAENAALAAKGANDINQLSNRAWLGPGRPFVNYSRPLKKGERLPLIGDRFNITVPFANTGKTPALFVRVSTLGVIVPIDRGKNGEEHWDVGFPDIKESDYEQVGNIPPDASVAKGIFPASSDINIWPTNLTKENVDALYAPTHRAVIFGKVLYCDVADPKVTHWFTFTMFLVLPGDPRFGLYPKPGYNDIGDYQQPCHGNQK